MYQYFKSFQIIPKSINDSGRVDYVRDQINIQVDRIVEYYRTSSMVINNNHLVKQILTHLNVSFTRDLESFTNAAFYESERLSYLFKLVHPNTNECGIYNNNFYGNGVSEIIIVDDTVFDFNKAYNNWEKLSPIKVHYHPFTDINGTLLNGNYKNNLNERGFAVISINIALLAVQYRAWYEKVNSQKEHKDSVESFVLKYPIVNAIYRHMEIAIINRTIAKWQGKPVAGYGRVHPINVSNHYDILDQMIEQRVDILNKNRYDFIKIFTSFKGLRRHNWLVALAMPDVPPMRNMKWAMELGVINYIDFYINYLLKQNPNGDKDIVNQIKRDIRILNSDILYYKEIGSQINILTGNIKTKLQG